MLKGSSITDSYYPTVSLLGREFNENDLPVLIKAGYNKELFGKTMPIRLEVNEEFTSNQTYPKTAKENENNNKSIFIVRGHDQILLNELMLMLLQEFSMMPLVMKDLPNEGQTLIEKFESIANQANYALVLLTPDDLIKNELMNTINLVQMLSLN